MEKAIFRRCRRSRLVQDEANHAPEAVTGILYEQSVEKERVREREGSSALEDLVTAAFGFRHPY